MNTYKRLPVAFERGEGSWLWDTEGKRYLDGLAGIAVCGLGHSHPKLVRALCEQAGKLIHTSNLYGIKRQEELADRLAAISGMDEVFFCNSGCEANEAALKIARLFGHNKGVELPAIIVLDKSFHGRTIATLSATGSRKVQAGFEPLVPGFVRVPFDDLPAIRKVAANNRNVVAVLVELIQGEGGINVCHDDYLHGLRQICDDNDWLLMLDEVQSGMGRTGKWFAYQLSGVKPDVFTLAKGLASGVPIGACLTAGRATGTFKPGNHGSTFGGNPLATATALATLAIIEEEGLMANAVAMGDLIRSEMSRELAGAQGVREIRGRGLLVGIELEYTCDEIVKRSLEAGLLVNVTNDNVVRLLPPLTISADEVKQLVAILAPIIKDFLARARSAQPAAQPA
jgi:acetylornithine/N-succinyldiaminopimelate aminotransferase